MAQQVRDQGRASRQLQRGGEESARLVARHPLAIDLCACAMRGGEEARRRGWAMGIRNGWAMGIRNGCQENSISLVGQWALGMGFRGFEGSGIRGWCVGVGGRQPFLPCLVGQAYIPPAALGPGPRIQSFLRWH
jgi:hypothetical protein